MLLSIAQTIAANIPSFVSGGSSGTICCEAMLDTIHSLKSCGEIDETVGGKVISNRVQELVSLILIYK